MIRIFKSSNADSRSASEITRQSVMADTRSHRTDVMQGMEFISMMISRAGCTHDEHKLQEFDAFYNALISENFKESDWYKTHVKTGRHHLKSYVPKDVNLVDVLHHLVDCTMAGLARSGNIYDVDLSPELLEAACANTVELLKKNIMVVN